MLLRNNHKPLSEKFKYLLFEKASLISFFLIFIFIFGGFLFFYLKVLPAVDSPLAVNRVQLPLDQDFWRMIMDDINRRHLFNREPQVIRDIFR